MTFLQVCATLRANRIFTSRRLCALAMLTLALQFSPIAGVAKFALGLDDGAAPNADSISADPAAPLPPLGSDAAIATDAAPGPAPPPPIGGSTSLPASGMQAVQFEGVRPGETTVQELLKTWGRPAQQQSEGEYTRRIYAREPFQRIVATCDGERVVAVGIHFRESHGPAQVLQSMDLASFAPVLMRDEAGVIVGQHIPERGATLRFAPREAGAKPLVAFEVHQTVDWPVSQVVLETIDPESFLWRAEARLNDDVSAAMRDANLALAVAPDFVEATAFRAELLLRHGQGRQALAGLEEALEAKPGCVPLELVRARILLRYCDFGAAKSAIDRLLSNKELEPHERAVALNLYAELLVAGPDGDAEKAAAWRGQAVELAERQSSHASFAVRREARRALIEAHMLMARDLAWGHWTGKAVVVPQWLSRCKTIARQGIAAGELPPDYARIVALGSLAAAAGLRGEIDPTEYVREALELGRKGVDAAVDPATARRMQWELGEALYDALQCCLHRNESQAALEYGGQAVLYLEKGLPGRQVAPAENYMLGKLYFRLGEMYSATPAGHVQAVRWFDRASPLLTLPLPEASFADVADQGETCVKMAVSYWSAGDRSRALELMEVGANLMEEAADEGLLEDRALAVPYENLATIHRKLGHAEEARQYAELAAKFRDLDSSTR